MATAALVLASAASDAARGADVSGSFKAAEGVISPKHAIAYAVRDPRNARQSAIEVVLSEFPMDAEEAAAALDPHTNAINQDGARQGNYILLWVRRDGDVSMNATFSKTMTQYLASMGELKAELSANSAERVAGRISTTKPLKTMKGETYEADMTFSAAIARVAAGTKLAAGGGDPGSALKALYAAMDKKNWKAMRAGVSEKTRAMLEADYRSEGENRDYALDLLGTWLPKKQMKVLGGELRGDTAVLEVEGEIFEGQKALYLVKMVKCGGGWCFDQAANAGML
jgi:hypothetical protein